MKEEMVDVTVYLDKDLADEINKMTKKELIGRLVAIILRNKVQDETVDDLEIHNATLKAKLGIAESNLEQAKGMIEAATRNWLSRL